MKTIYLLLGIGVPVSEYAEAYDITKTSPNPVDFGNFVIEPIRVSEQDIELLVFKEHETIYSLKFVDGRKDDNLAQRIADALCASVTFIDGPLYYDGIIAYPIDEYLISKNGIVLKDSVIKIDQALPWDEQLGDMEIVNKLNTTIVLSRQVIDLAFHILLEALSEDMFEALHFYQQSVLEVEYFPGLITDILSQPDKVPHSAVQRKKFENALQNAFKAIEALVGDPPKDDGKFKTKLAQAGVNPDEKVGYDNKDSFFNKLRNMGKARDKNAAHGKSAGLRRITQYELMDYQQCTRHVIDRILSKRLSR